MFVPVVGAGRVALPSKVACGPDTDELNGLGVAAGIDDPALIAPVAEGQNGDVGGCQKDCEAQCQDVFETFGGLLWSGGCDTTYSPP